MPKYGIHHVVLQDATQQLIVNADATAQAAGATLDTHRDLATLGAVGPDLFFWSPDYEAVDKIYRLHKNIETVVDLYNSVVQPMRDIRDAVVDPIADTVESLAPSTVALIRTTIEEMKETADLFKAAVGTGLFAGVITGFNFLTDLANLPSLSATFFDLFRPPLQNNEAEDKWYWFDMLHYRQTGAFAHALVENAGTDPVKQAYAYGYLSHIATDVVGHAFVNQVVGGPYRLHPQRHVTVENYMDCWKFDQYYGESVNLTLVDKLGLPSALPSGVRDQIRQSFQDAYQNVPHPTRLPGDGFLTAGQIDQTYEIFYEILQIMKKMAVKRPEEPFSGVADILEDALQDLLEPPPSPPSSPSSACSLGDIFSFGLTSSSRDCYENFFDELSEWFEYLGELFAWALETLLDLFDLLLTLLLSLPVIVLLSILYGIQLLLYEIYQTVREVLALEGMLFPEPEYLNGSHGRNLTTTFQCQITPFKYPKAYDLANSHLSCASPGIETPTTAADFHASSDLITPDEFIRNIPLDLETLAMYAQSESPSQTRSIERDYLRIGNATDLTEWMIHAAADPTRKAERLLTFANWNLDADRGYGYKQWQGAVPDSGTGEVDNEDYI